MLGTLTMELTIDAFCLTSDNVTEHHCDDRERLCNWFCGSGESHAVRDSLGPTGLLFGETMPYELVGLTMKSVGKAGDVLVKEYISSRGLVHDGSGDAHEEPGFLWFVSDIFNNGVSRERLVDCYWKPVAFERATARGLCHGRFRL